MAGRSRFFLILQSLGIMAAALVLVDVSVVAQSPPTDTTGGKVEKVAEDAIDRKAPRPVLSETDLNATMAFAAEHHPELARLLEHLKKSRKSEFHRAMRELNQQMVSLEKLRERNPSRYIHQLELWKTDSQIRVLVAKWSQTEDEKIAEDIRQLLRHRRDTKLSQLKAEHLRLSDQLQKLENQIKAASASEELDHEWEQLAKKTNASRKLGSKNVQKNPAQSSVGKDGPG
ncbi:MAG TPA: hypothetical protein PLR25_17820 [Planctomycetaceae bacterium]|nr:hypothetical protein [Planctomycetaceae bacterium]